MIQDLHFIINAEIARSETIAVVSSMINITSKDEKMRKLTLDDLKRDVRMSLMFKIKTIVTRAHPFNTFMESKGSLQKI